MTRCPICSQELPEDTKKCPSCGTSLEDLSAPTRLFPAGAKTFTQRAHSPGTTSFDSIDDARFVPGTILADRYRIVGLIGKGGMGEVYRADDLKLSQPVALKFLPDHLLSDAAALARFHREVRIARQVSHHNVCRVYDIGELDGHHFLSMEYIKGEELSSLLRRIGRLPADKAIEIARQLCAGLAAAHNRGVLHRDLKPANVMIDNDGNVRITDFGIAGLIEELRDDDTRTGTPAYMSPEQLAGKELTVKSDIYSLGLVLYELFTGKKVFAAPTLPQLLDLRHGDATPTLPSTLISDLDPVVERLILRCLEKDPDKRPESALQVAAALPGGDPLAAALAAGEIPSPEMVAAAPMEGILRPAVAILYLTLLVVGIALVVMLAEKTMLHRQIPLEKSPEVLRDRAREVIRKLGYDNQPIDTAYGLENDSGYIRYVLDHDASPTRWALLKTGQVPTISFWYRQSPRYLLAYSSLGDVGVNDPPETITGMARATLDTQGRLISFSAVPPQLDQPEDQSSKNQDQNWSPLFNEAGLDLTKFKRVTPQWIPTHYSDAREAWEGKLPAQADIPIRIEAAAYRGKPTYFQIIFPWTTASRQDNLPHRTLFRIINYLALAIVCALLLGSVLLALRNLRLGLGDRRGAFRLAVFTFTVGIVAHWVLQAHHVSAIQGEFNTFLAHAAATTFFSGLVAVFYLALEPLVRARWPQLIISWNRLLTGNFRDPLVGRDLLIGGLLGVGVTIISRLRFLAPQVLGRSPNQPGLISPNDLLAFRVFLSHFLAMLVGNALLSALAVQFLLVLLFIVVRKVWPTAIGSWLLMTLVLGLTGGNPAIDLPFAAVFSALILLSFVRFGVLASVSLFFFWSVISELPLTADFSVWYASSSIFALLALGALAVYAFYTSLGGQSILREGSQRS